MATTASQRDPIVLTDPNVEHSLVVKEVLDIIYNLEVNARWVFSKSNLHLYVIDFAKKWEMNMITDFIQKELARDLNGHDHALRAFDYLLLALNLGDNSLAVSCYEAMRSESWVGYEHKMDYHGDGVRSHGQLADDKPVGDPQPADESEFEEEDGLPIQYLSDRPPQRLTENNPLTQEINGPFGDLGAMPLNWFLRLPPTIAWIILRANIHEELGLGSGKAKIKELLNLAYPPPKLSKSSK